MHRNIFLLLITFSLMSSAVAQEHTLELTLEETIEQARQQSPDAQNARHSFRSAYWNYKYYCANYLPTLKLTSNPYLDRAINKVTQSDGNVKFIEQNLLSTDLTLSLTQNVPWTGGTFFIETAAQRLDLFSSDTYSWQTSPVNIGYSQSLFGYNSLKWDRRIEPIRYREAKKTYVETLELVAANATEKFFNLTKAQSNYEIANANYANADTLYIYAQGRYNIGTISENEMLQLELNKLTEETNCMNARIEVENCMQELRSYLGIQEDLLIKVRIDNRVPDLHIDLDAALMLANENSPEIQNMLRRKVESESAVSRAKANAGLKADIYLRFGLTQTADKLKDAYRNPLDQQYVSLGITLPILDWGRGRGQVRVGPFQPRPCLHAGRARQDGFRLERTETRKAIQPAGATGKHSRPHGPYSPTTRRSSPKTLSARQVLGTRPQCIHHGKRYGPEKLYNGFVQLLEFVLCTEKHHAI